MPFTVSLPPGNKQLKYISVHFPTFSINILNHLLAAGTIMPILTKKIAVESICISLN